MKQLISLIFKNCPEIGITGGETTLMGDLFFELTKAIKEDLPETEIHYLTNGRSFAWNNIASRLKEINADRLVLGIPLYSDYHETNDYIVQTKDAFNQTVKGLHNLAANHQRIEIRIVLHKQTIPRLIKLAKYIYYTKTYHSLHTSHLWAQKIKGILLITLTNYGSVQQTI